MTLLELRSSWSRRAALLFGAASVLSACKSESSSAPPLEESPINGTAQPATSASLPVRVEATADGFHPSRVVLGGSKQVVFRRTSEGTCATEVVFPELGIEKKLPLNTDVTVDLPASAPNEIGFQCGMGMYKSKIVAQ
jgi:plastocyanin domain-containing protein